MKRGNLDRRLITILLIVFVQMLGAAMILPILPLYAKREFAMEPQTITLLLSAFFAAQFVAGPYLGRLSDRHGRIPVLIVSQIGTAVSFLMLAFAPSAIFLFLARILDGVTGGNIIVAQAYITDITPREKRTEALGYVFAVFGVGFIFGPALGGLLAAALGPRMPYVIAAGVATLVVILTYFTLDETLSAEQRAANRRFRRQSLSLPSVFRNTPLFLVLLIAFVGQFGLGLLQSTFALFGEAVLFAGYDADATNLGIGLLLATVGIGQVFTQTVLLRRAKARFGDALLVIIGSVIRTVGLLVFAVAMTPFIGAVASLLFAVGMGLMMPPLQSLTTLAVADEMRGGALGVYQSSVSLATIVSTAIAGLLFAANATLPFWIGAGLSLLATIPAVVVWRRLQRGEASTQEVSATAD